MIEIECIINLLPARFFHENQSLVLKRLGAAGLKGSLCTPLRRDCGDRRVSDQCRGSCSNNPGGSDQKLLLVEVMKNGQILEIL